jgi:hypothetical protein
LFKKVYKLLKQLIKPNPNPDEEGVVPMDLEYTKRMELQNKICQKHQEADKILDDLVRSRRVHIQTENWERYERNRVGLPEHYAIGGGVDSLPNY